MSTRTESRANANTPTVNERLGRAFASLLVTLAARAAQNFASSATEKRTQFFGFFFVVLAMRKGGKQQKNPLWADLLNNLWLQCREPSALTPSSETRPFGHEDAVGTWLPL
ncbi:hypothetical protein EVAR_18238_1 [Eumeta japonica]|uniref:Uncharacterized protein n=1 Tax=Eumeta variegata TaxID=151549 RepID=A0A4C1UJE7_EUMVA|nr:hypothetical protein EVAR_18238_1 [Eumeta japonica]